MIAVTLSARQYFSLLPGCAAGIGLAFVAAVAIRQCWLAQSRTPLWLAISGIAAIAIALFLDRIIPLVNAITEPPTLIERIRYPSMLAVIAVLTLLLPAVARAALRRSA